MRMPFGKFQGWPLKELSDSYLHWLLTIELREPLRAAVRCEAELRGLGPHEYRKHAPRGDSFRPPEPPRGLQLRPAEIPLARRVFDAGYRALARATHPDVGGDAAEMRALNALAESVRTQFRALGGV